MLYLQSSRVAVSYETLVGLLLCLDTVYISCNDDIEEHDDLVAMLPIVMTLMLRLAGATPTTQKEARSFDGKF